MAHETGQEIVLAGENGVGAAQSTEVDNRDKLPAAGFTITPVSRKMQEIGQHMLDSARLVEVQEGLFTTCQDPVESFGDRLLRARDTGVPLIEVATFPGDGQFDALAQLFGVASNRLVRSVVGTDGVERNDGFWGNQIEYVNVGLSIPTIHIIDVSDNGSGYGTEVSAVLESGRYHDYDESRELRWGKRGQPSFAGGFTYEHEMRGSFLMNEALDRMASDFEIAIVRDGSIEGHVVAEDSTPGALNPGQPATLPPAAQ